MAFHVHVLMFNEHFSQEHADAHFDGEESANNKKYDWEDEMNLTVEIDEVKTLDNDKVILRGTKGQHESFEIPLEKMKVFQFLNAGTVVAEIASSMSLYEDHVLNEEAKNLTLYLKGEPYANPIPGIYVASLEFPKELIQGD